MPLNPGDRLGPYVVDALLGAGGMGEVYRARDTALNRDVALKVLPDILGDDPDLLARFRREAQTLAALNHPNVAAIYGIEHGQGPGAGGSNVLALVMELVEGEDLAARLARGAVPPPEAVDIAAQIAHGLEAAHEQGIVHRDLKPANVKVRPDGTVKVLDFGLAKATERPGQTAAGVANSPTFTGLATGMGMIIGTAAYMAPEQARGAVVDKRADIWAFGVVVFEMLTGRRLFPGDTVSDTLASVLKGDIDFAQLPSDTPSEVRRLLRLCLERNPKNRLHDIADARIALEEVRAGVEEDRSESTPAAAPRSAARRLAWVAAALALAALAAIAGYMWPRNAAPSRNPMRLSILLDTRQELRISNNAIPIFAADGRSLIIPVRENGQAWLAVRPLDGAEARTLEGSANAESPSVSQDGQWIGFVSGNKLMRVASAGGRPYEITDSTGAGAAWLPDGTIVYAPIYSDGLFKVAMAGGAATRLTTPDRAGGVLGHFFPDPLPGGRLILFTAFRTPVDRSRIGVLDLDTGNTRWIVEGGFHARYVPTGHLVFVRGERLFAVPFDPATATVLGAEAAVVENMGASQTGGFGLYAISSLGDLAYVSEAVSNPTTELTWIDRTGRAAPAGSERRRFRDVSLSPDTRQAVVTIQEGSLDLWLFAIERGTLSRLTSAKTSEYGARWSRDGKELFYIFDRPPFELFRMSAGAQDSGQPIWKETPQFDSTEITVGPDGRTIGFTRTEPNTAGNLYTRLIDGSAPDQKVRATPSHERMLTFAPDGRFVAYQSNDTGRDEIYVEPYPGPGSRTQISSDGGTEPIWAGNGEIFFRHDDEMRVVATRRAAGFDFTAARTLYSYPFVENRGAATYDVASDGSRVLAITVPATSVPRRVEIVTNWTAQLERLAPHPKR